MINLIVTSFFFFLISLFQSQSTTANLQITIQNVKESKGKMRVAVYRQSDDFLARDSYNTFLVDATAPTTTIEVQLPPDKYAIALVQDLNANKKMDRNFIGLPEEPYGISRNPSTGLSRPTFQQASFSLQGDMSITIEMVHL